MLVTMPSFHLHNIHSTENQNVIIMNYANSIYRLIYTILNILTKQGDFQIHLIFSAFNKNHCLPNPTGGSTNQIVQND